MAEDIKLRPISGLNLMGRDHLISEARKHLKEAAHFLRLAEHNNMEPFRVSKMINIIAKAAYVDYCVLDFLLGGLDDKDKIQIELRTHGAMLLIAQMEDEE